MRGPKIQPRVLTAAAPASSKPRQLPELAAALQTDLFTVTFSLTFLTLNNPLSSS